MSEETAVPEETPKEPSLDELLNEWSSEDGKPEETPKADPSPAKEALDPTKIETLANYVEQQQQRELQETFERDVGAAVKALKENDVLSKVPDRFVRGALEELARTDERFMAAWQNRHRDEARFQRVIKGVAEDFATELGSQPDDQLTEDREAVRASVRTQSTASQPAEPDVRDMSPNEIIAFTDKLARQNRR